jgi:ABC-type glutathione transport system ATPase component
VCVCVCQLRRLRGKVSVVAIVGMYRSGKSYLMNHLMGRDNAFPVSDAGDVAVAAASLALSCCALPSCSEARVRGALRRHTVSCLLFCRVDSC